MSPPFDAEKYKALMSGLECSEINSSELENEFTLGSEYYSKRYVSPVNQLRKISKLNYLCDISAIITDGDHGTAEYVEEGIPYILSESVKEGYIDTSCLKTISKNKHQTLLRSELKPGDIVITKTGIYFGKSAVIPPSLPTSNTIAHVAKVRLKKEFNPYWVSTFMNSKYGYAQLRRRGIKATRPEIKLIEMQHILVPMASNELLESVENTVILANNYLTQSKEVFTDAQNLLSHDLGLDNWHPSEEKISVRSAKEVEQVGRWDAEYYQPKYDEIGRFLKGFRRAQFFLDTDNFIPKPHREYVYIELNNILASGIISPDVPQSGEELPTRARRLIHEGQVIVSSIEGSLQSCALVTAEYDGAICSNGFFVMSSEDINPETLLVLMKSQIMQAQLKQLCSGSILAAVNVNDMKNIYLPTVTHECQEKIKECITEMYKYHRSSTALFTAAKRAVEIAIEDDESTALSYLKSQTDLYIDEKYSIYDSQQYLKVAEPDSGNEISNIAKGTTSDE